MRGSSWSVSVLVDPLSHREISRVWAVSPSLGGTTAFLHLKNYFGLPHSGVPQCDVYPFCCSFILNPQSFPQVAHWHPWLVSVFAMRSPFLGRGCFSQLSIVMKTLLTLFYIASESSRWGHLSRVEVAIFFIAHSIGIKSLAEPDYQVLRDEVPLWVVCGPWSTLDLERRISLVFGLSFFRMWSPF